jgi:hypothetical protein
MLVQFGVRKVNVTASFFSCLMAVQILSVIGLSASPCNLIEILVSA